MSAARISLPSLRDLGLPTPARPYNMPMYSNARPLRPLVLPRRRRTSVSSSNTDSSYEPESEIERTPSLSPPPSPGRYSANSSFATTIMPRTPSPPPLSQSQRRRVRSRAEVASARQNRAFKLVLTTLPKADAILFVPAPDRGTGTTSPTGTLRPDVAPISNFARQQRGVQQIPSPTPVAGAPSGKRQRALLLFGSAMHNLRTPLGLARLQVELAKGARIHPYKMLPEDAVPRRSSAPASMLAAIAQQ
ncbi:hypothetical protein SCHPADRAFT_936756 [Schizopora paradoxa]|uniref:Uncharacterized protein n=1 Tax=Schizopora paradoxa TaxID=27342 RepID=A0A0H2S063_9AGAM|nr:hypothetical protein SCHPADRAFT_936756 [Schizopora paradoxa]